ncbi:MAG: sugar phosphate isomerase/epimerase [Anaerolineae bacterium]|nr:sugar phosphate isomerase/epimerase [Anaerolineae bacterium]
MTNFPLGVCTWTFGDLPLADIAERVSRLKLDGVELLGDLSRYTAREAGHILADHNLQTFSLTPTDADISHPDPAVRQAGVDYYYRLLDFAAGLGQPLVSCHGFVGRVRPVTTQVEENQLLLEAFGQIAKEAQSRNLRLVFEVLNRYETHQVHTGAEAKVLLDATQAENAGILLDAYHMNIEEPDPAEAIRHAGAQLWLYHAADSNRQAVGRGHTDFKAHVQALHDIGYDGPIIFECVAPGPNPFTPIKDDKSLTWLETYLAESRDWFRANTRLN